MSWRKKGGMKVAIQIISINMRAYVITMIPHTYLYPKTSVNKIAGGSVEALQELALWLANRCLSSLRLQSNFQGGVHKGGALLQSFFCVFVTFKGHLVGNDFSLPSRKAKIFYIKQMINSVLSQHSQTEFFYIKIYKYIF